MRNGTYENWKKDGVKPGGIVAVVVFLAVIFAGVRACSSWFENLPDRAEKKNQIASGTLTVPPGQDVFFKLDIKQNFENAKATGKFKASGGPGNDITAFIADETDTINWKNGHKSKVLWQTDGDQTVGEFNVPLSAGTAYYLVLSNSSAVSEKQVALDAILTFTERTDKSAAQ